MCFFDETVAWDRSDLEFQRRSDSKNLTLAGMADCGQLRAVRAGETGRLRSFGYVKSQLPNVGSEPLNISREAYVREVSRVFRQQGTELLTNAQEKWKTKVDEARLNIKLGGATNLGVIYQEPDMVAILMLAHMLQGKENVDRLGAMGLTLVRGIPLSINLYREFDDTSVVPALIAESRGTMKRLIQLNK